MTTIETTSVPPLVRPSGRPWEAPAQWWPGLTRANEAMDPPYGVLAWDALSHNAFDLLDRAAGKPLRIASKSVRVRGVLDAVLALPGWAGILAYTLPEALWLAEDHDDVVVGYPSADRAAIARLVADERLASRVTLMVDDVAQLDLVDAVAAPGARAQVRVCLELDASYRSPVAGHVGVRRSPVHDVGQARRAAEAIVRRPGFRLVGMMAYEAQVAGLTNEGAGRGRVIRALQRASVEELTQRRSAAVSAVRAVADLEFVNGGGTGSIESTSADPSVTEIAAGSGLFGPHLFDHYVHFTPAPAAAFALSVVRRPKPDTVTLMGGGWVASGPPGADRLPLVAWPEGLSMLPREMAGEVQTPLRGRAARTMSVGDRVWLRHTKAGELSEHLASFAVVHRGEVVGQLPTYRGEGKVFL
ncbi:alanine racemase [Lapillicoccus jejuensis]|uniref:D-serine deaminase-like pyridoxal phosphate-dependent protein n=1 Tax=Lapillicoccus jejuensis TaxID=402171 RepID=A0A542DVA0_9MICO|nr:alanine racemase [Lapillicoccus jejuensis]TQJ07022.1 D-serine deaminase-like pyridoxal phosphate-dependent protein [Lapillicoccus jejuensis]